MPITPHLLRQIKAVWDVNAADPDYIMLWPACCLAFFAFLRAGELTVPNDSGFDASSHLAWGDIGVDNPRNPAVLSVGLKASNTDRALPYMLGRVLPWLAILVPLFFFKDGRPLTRQHSVSAVWDVSKFRHPAIPVTVFGSGQPQQQLPKD